MLRIVVCVFILIFFFFKQKTAYEMRISDWSSDVCSSDLKMIEDNTAQAARLLLDSRNHRRPIEALPEYCRPATTAQAYAIQDAVADLLGPVGGWKVGAKGHDAQPNCDPLPATHVIEAPAHVPPRQFPLRGIEAEHPINTD